MAETATTPPAEKPKEELGFWARFKRASDEFVINLVRKSEEKDKKKLDEFKESIKQQQKDGQPQQPPGDTRIPMPPFVYGNPAQANVAPGEAGAATTPNAPLAQSATAPQAKMSRAQEAGSQVEQGIVENIAIFTKENFTVLYTKAYQISGEKLQPPQDDEGYLKLSRELIEKRQLTLNNESGKPVTITLDQVDANEKAQAKKTAEEFGVKFDENTPKFSSMIPTKAQVKNTANAVADGVEENTGGLFGLFDASLSNIFKGIWEWIQDGFKGSFSGLFEKIRETTAKNTVASVKDNLGATDTGLSTEQRAEIVERVKGRVDVAAGVKGAKTPEPGKKLSDVKAPDLSELSALGATLGAPSTPAPERNEETQKAAPEQNPLPKPELIPLPALPTPAPVNSRLKDAATAVTTQIMRSVGNNETPNEQTIGLIIPVLQDNKDLLESKNYKALADKTVVALLKNPETAAKLKTVAKAKLTKEYNDIDNEKPEGLGESTSRFTRLSVKQLEMTTFASAPETIIKMKLPEIITPILENGAGQTLLDSMKPENNKVSSLSELVDRAKEPNLVVANVPNPPAQFIPQGGSTTGTGLNTGR